MLRYGSQVGTMLGFCAVVSTIHPTPAAKSNSPALIAIDNCIPAINAAFSLARTL